MGFLQPLLLPFAALAAAPIVIHLLTRSRARQQLFPPIALLLRIQQNTARFNRWRERALLAVRTALVVALALALAGPFLSGVGAAPDTGGNEPTAFVIDNSASMLARSGGSNLLELATEWVQARLAGLEGRVHLLRLGALEPDEASLASSDLDALSRFLKDTRPYFGAVRALHGIKEALGKLPEGGHIYVLSDLRKTSWESEGGAIKLPDNVGVDVVDMAAVWEGASDGVVEMRARPTRHGTEWDLNATVALGPGNGKPDAVVTLRAGSTTVGRIVLNRTEGNLLNAVAQVAPPVQGEALLAEARLAADDLPHDDIRYFAADTRTALRVTLVEGEFGSVPLEGEAFYLSKAFLKVPRGGTELQPAIIRPHMLEANTLKATDVLILANVALASLPKESLAGIPDAVRRGMGLILFMGKRAESAEYNERLGAILPVVFGGEQAVDPVPGQAGIGLTAVNWGHPLLEPFAGGTQGGPSLVRVERYARLQPISGRGAVILRLGNGDAYLVEGRAGAGGTLVFASTADREWNDLPVHPAFVALVQQAVFYLAVQGSPAGPRNVLAGERVRLAWPDPAARRVAVRPPEGESFDLPVQTEGSRAWVEFAVPGPPGFYRLGGVPRDGDRQLVVAVNPDPRESVLERVGEAEIKERIVGDVQLRTADRALMGWTTGTGRQDLTPIVLLLVAGLVAGELLLGNPR
ncbi:MAG: BatA domain-containing protein [Nitrospirae bacterium]|nr:BatA domain-containing protein [Nitrospirota bacterium]